MESWRRFFAVKVEAVGIKVFLARNKYIATGNMGVAALCATSSNGLHPHSDGLQPHSCIAFAIVTSASFLVTSALIIVTRSD